MYLNFYRNSNGIETTNVIECTHYEMLRFSDRVEVIIYKDYFTKEGACYTLCENDIEGRTTYKVCFVENINGKTIDTIKVK